MAHHSSEGPFEPLNPEGEKRLEEMRKMMQAPAIEALREKAFGATGRQAEVTLAPNDEGEIRFGVTSLKDDAGETKVVIDFGTPVYSVGMTKEQACEMGRLLITRAGYACRIQID